MHTLVFLCPLPEIRVALPVTWVRHSSCKSSTTHRPFPWQKMLLLSPCMRWKFADWDVPAAMLGLLGVAWANTVLLKDNYHREGYCMCCLNYKGKEVEGHELKLHRLTADKKLHRVRWSPLSETGQKSDSLFATIIHTASFYTILFTLFRTEFFQYPHAFENLG